VVAGLPHSAVTPYERTLRSSPTFEGLRDKSPNPFGNGRVMIFADYDYTFVDNIIIKSPI